MRFLFFLSLLFLAGAARGQSLGKTKAHLTVQRLAEKTNSSFYAARTLKTTALSTDPCAMIVPCTQKPLPVTLISFTGERLNESSVLLLWQTSEEVNNDYFQIERTLNPSIGFQTVGVVKGAGSSKSAVKYQTTDPNDNSDYTYYRLKQVDFDGSYQYSSIVAVKGSKMPFDVAAFPNPSQAKTLLFRVRGLKATEQLKIAVYDLAGNTVYQNDNKKASPDQQNLNLGLQSLSPGKYSIKVQSSKELATDSFVIVP
ncbi:T9SS type A sorting domain-containing protein [Dyadobacter subterraneus]|uniref:T9SS type A sorting domain-containing protein n=1 Tax=Dyadobacter subterraneus TaxID=2773304 RepID=A0ABR9WCS1_9BACT|nr:T9SS type A sorting domain-containing protein [Dyadobacter subterraneus]MBE9463282.1 T9SS type A sorting domain-containing protein [Dyadobacter subterraneus]